MSEGAGNDLSQVEWRQKLAEGDSFPAVSQETNTRFVPTGRAEKDQRPAVPDVSDMAQGAAVSEGLNRNP